MVIPEIVRHPGLRTGRGGCQQSRQGGRRRRRDLRDRPRWAWRPPTTSTPWWPSGPDALVHFGPTAAHADDNIRDIGAFLRAGIDVCSTAMTPWVWPTMTLNPPSWIEPDHRGLPGGRCVLLHHRYRPGIRQRPVPHDPDGPVRRGAPGAGPRDPRLHQLRGGLRGRDGHRPAARVRPAARAHRHPGHVVGGHGPDDGPCGGHRARRDHHHLGEVDHRHSPSPRPRA